jgi:hypothetical protein
MKIITFKMEMIGKKNFSNTISQEQPKSLSTEGQMFDESEKSFFAYLIKIHEELSSKSINLKSLEIIFQKLESIRKLQQNEYWATLMHPERYKNCKIPSPMPIPSSSFQLKNSFYLTPNVSGNACVIINPYYLNSDDLLKSTVYVNNDSSLTGTETSNYFYAVDGGQRIPKVYNSYRLVSASVVARYTGRFDVVQGLIGGAIIFDNNINATDIGYHNESLQKYGNFNLAQDAYYQQEHYTLQGMRELYFPLDTTFEQYQKVGVEKLGYGMLFYFSATPGNIGQTFKFDLYFNFECLPDVEFLNYIPTTISNVCYDSNENKKAHQNVQDKLITNGDDVNNKRLNRSSGGFFSNLIDKIGSILPSVVQLLPYAAKLFE